MSMLLKLIGIYLLIGALLAGGVYTYGFIKHIQVDLSTLWLIVRWPWELIKLTINSVSA
jgi:hypothetical protein